MGTKYALSCLLRVGRHSVGGKDSTSTISCSILAFTSLIPMDNVPLRALNRPNHCLRILVFSTLILMTYMHSEGSHKTYAASALAGLRAVASRCSPSKCSLVWAISGLRQF